MLFKIASDLDKQIDELNHMRAELNQLFGLFGGKPSSVQDLVSRHLNSSDITDVKYKDFPGEFISPRPVPSPTEEVIVNTEDPTYN